MKQLCIANIVNKKYQGYIPFYIYYVFRLYPDYSVFIYTDSTLNPHVKESLKLLEGMGEFKIKPLNYKCDKNNIQAFKTLRWVLYDKEFNDFENIYIGDIDILLLKEKLPLLEAHINHCREQNLPYSNCVRTGNKKLTGLHFMQTEPYFKKTLPAIKKYQRLIEANKFNGHNEETLLKIITESQLTLPTKQGDYINHHGLHLRVFVRNVPISQYKRLKNYAFTRIFKHYYKQFWEATTEKKFSQLMNIAKKCRYSRDADPYSQISNVKRLCIEAEKGRL